MPTLWRGRHSVCAFWYPERGGEAARRILADWRAGAEVYELHTGWLLRLPSPEWMDTSGAPAMPLVEEAGVLWGSVPSEADRARVGNGHVVVPIAGVAEVAELGSLTRLAPDQWLDVSGFARVEVVPLGPPAAPAPTPRRFEIRQALQRPPVAPASTALFGALTAGSAAAPHRGVLATRIGAFMAWLAGVEPKGGAADPSAPPRAPAPARPPSALVRWFRRVAAPLWGFLLGGAHGQHLTRLLELFERDKLDEALRWAIPLGGAHGDLGPAWERPTPRADLSLRTFGVAATSTVNLENDLLVHLRRLYESAFRRLLHERRVDDAVFVLVELLKEHGRAVDLLEKEEQFALAAEVAEASSLPRERAVQLWVRAGNLTRAIELARRTGAFAAAVAALARTDTSAAQSFRWAWSTHLAERGDFAGAVTVAWESPALRPRAVPWLDAALSAGTPAAASLVALLLRQTAETFEIGRGRVMILLEGEQLERVRLREALGAGLLTAGGAHGKRLLRPVVRALVSDQRRFPELVDTTLLRKLAAGVDDPALAADLPAFAPTGQPLRTRSKPLHLDIASGDAGTTPVYDAAWFADGGLLVALGELGARVYAADGRVRATFDVPATALVPNAEHGQALAVSARSWGARVSRLNLQTRRCAPWHDGRYTSWADTYDGNLWFVAEGERAIALDVLAPEATSLWSVGQVGGAISAVRVGADTMGFVVGEGSQRQVWRHRLPDIRLLSRPPCPGGVDPAVETLDERGMLHELRSVASDGSSVVLDTVQVSPDREEGGRVALGLLAGPGWRPLGIRAHGEWAAFALHRHGSRETGAHVGVVLAFGGAPRLTLRLRDASRVSIRLTADTLTVADDRGRVFVFELWRGSCLRDLRVR